MGWTFENWCLGDCEAIPVAMRSTGPRVLVTCPEGHEWWVQVRRNSPPQPQLVVCPLCQQSHDVLLPMIVKTEALLVTER
jgi:hypothetical protein